MRGFVKEFGWENVLNMRGMTWRRMSDEEKAGITDAESAIALMLEKSSIIKRPILAGPNGNLLGFDADAWAAQLT